MKYDWFEFLGDGLACGSEIDSVSCYDKVADDLDKMLPNITELKYERDNLIK